MKTTQVAQRRRVATIGPSLKTSSVAAEASSFEWMRKVNLNTPKTTKGIVSMRYTVVWARKV
jgi:hypothetical protein